MPTKLCLLILFNHRFEANLPKLEWLYRDRFEHIRYLIPFYRGDRPDVIATYYSSFQFQGFFMEAWKRLRAEGFTHFLICADDMVLTPRLTDKNFLELLGIDAETGFNKSLRSLTEYPFRWSHLSPTLLALAGNNGVNWERELPPAETAAAELTAKGYPPGEFGWKNFRRGLGVKTAMQLAFYGALRMRKGVRPTAVLKELPYPLLVGNADLLLVPASAMEPFTFFCSVFAAMGIFVEVAAPTALALACRKVADEDAVGWAVNDCIGWTGAQDYEAFCQRHDYRLDRLLEAYEERVLCIHPVKLSQWSVGG